MFKPTMNAVLVSSYCSSLVEFVTPKCQLYYLHRDITIVLIAAVSIPSGSNARQALSELYRTISNLQIVHPDRFFVTADFNHANLKSVLPKL